MQVHEQVGVLDDILENWRGPLGGDFAAYKNHCYRVLNFALALSPENADAAHKLAIAAAFHDLGIWAHGTYDYLGPSAQLARDYLATSDRSAWSDEIASMIEQHHKLRRYKANPHWLVETFRKADWIDVSRGRLKFGIPGAYIAKILARFPNAGFHKRLIALTRQRLKTHPLSPLPMMKL